MTNSLHAQEYTQQYIKCAERLKNVEDDSLYMIRLWEKDSCLTGANAPNFKVTAIDGQHIELNKLKGQVVFLNFWGTKCGPCVEEIPGLNELVRYYIRKKVKFIALAGDKEADLKKFLKKNPFHFIQIADAEKIYTDEFKLTDINPYTVIVDKSGKIYKIEFGGVGASTFSFYKKILDKCLSDK